MIKDEANIDERDKLMKIKMHVDVAKKLGKERTREIRAIAEEQIRERVKEKGRKLTHKEEIVARRIELKDVSKESVELAKTVPCNPILSLKEALQTLGIKTNKETLRLFYAPRSQGDVTVTWWISVLKDEMKRVYELGLLTGAKKDNYEVRYKEVTNSVRLVDPVNKVWKLSEEQAEKLVKKHKNYCQKKGKKIKYMPFSEIEKEKDFGEIVKSIYEKPPENLIKKYFELNKKGIETEPPKPHKIYFPKQVISVQWWLEWFEK